MKEKREVDLSQKGTLEAFELSDNDLEQVSGGTVDPNEKPSCYRPAFIDRYFEPGRTCNDCAWIDVCMH